MQKALTIFIALLLLLLAGVYVRQQSGGQPEVRVLKLAHGLNTKHPVHLTMVYMAELVKEKSGGRLRVEIFPSEQLGNEKECIEALQLGYLAMTKTSSAPLEAFVPEFRVLGIPYIFRDGDHFWKVVLDTPIGKELLHAGVPKGLKGLCYYDAGARSFYTKKAPVLSPGDLAGLKIRVQNSVMSMEMIKAMGGSPTPISWGELYTSLDQGVVDGAENNPPSFYTSRHYEVCGYYSLDEHLRIPDLLLISPRIWSSLSSEFQQILQEAVDASVSKGRELWAAAERQALARVEKAGVKIVRPDKEPFRQAVMPMWRQYEQDPVLGDLMRRIREVD